jgi:TRAP-type transport system small permease protein
LKEFMEKTSITVNKASQVVIFVFFVTAFLSTVYQVFSRFVLQGAFVQEMIPMVDFSVFNLTWIEELIRYLFVWIVFLGIGVVYKSKEHAQVEVLHHYLPKKYKSKLLILIEVINSSLFLFLIIFGSRILKFTSQQISPSMGLNMTIIYGAVLICFIICLIHSLVNLLGLVISKSEKNEITRVEVPGEGTNIG